MTSASFRRISPLIMLTHGDSGPKLGLSGRTYEHRVPIQDIWLGSGSNLKTRAKSISHAGFYEGYVGIRVDLK